MAMKIARACLALCVIAVLLYSPRLLFSCGPFFPSTVFTYTLHPDFPLERFARGELGVLQPTYARSYLAVAYRYLSGAGLNPEEQKAAQALWQERLDLHWNADGQNGIQRWRDVRNAVPGVGALPEIEVYRPVADNEGDFGSYLNCPVDAFRTAVSTLEKRIAQFGADSAAVRDDTESGKKLAPIVISLIPALQQNLDAYLAADSSEARKFAAVFLMLHFPGTRPYIGTGVSRLTPLEQIDNYRDNWWCSFAEPGELDTPNFLRLNRVPQMTPDSDPGQIGALTTISPAFLDQAQQKTAEQEWQHLVNLGVAPNYFTRLVIDWAQKHQDDQRVPEALYLAVRSTRYGCTDEQSSVFSKQAFQLLHRRYADSSWAKKTPYWY